MSRRLLYQPQGGYIDEGYEPSLVGGATFDISKYLLGGAMPKKRSKSRGRTMEGAMTRSRSKSRTMGGADPRMRSKSKSRSKSRSASRSRAGTSLGGSLLSEASRALKGIQFPSREARGKAVAKLVRDFKKAAQSY